MKLYRATDEDVSKITKIINTDRMTISVLENKIQMLEDEIKFLREQNIELIRCKSKK